MSDHSLIGRRRFIAACIPPFPDESLLGFLTRALSLTAVRGLKAALKLAGIRIHNPVAITTLLTETVDVASLAHVFGCDPSEIRSRVHELGQFEHSTARTVDFFGTKIRLQYLETKVRRVSPRALEAEPYCRAISALRPFSFDPTTGEQFLDTCPVCNEKLGWRRAHGVTMCDVCVGDNGLPNVDLRDFPQPVVETNDPEALQFVSNLVDPSAERKAAARRLLPTAWQDVSNAEVFETVMAMADGLTRDPADPKPAESRVKRFRKDDFRPLQPDALALSGRGIIGGQAGFDAIAEIHRAEMHERPGFYGRAKEVGPLAYLTSDFSITPEARCLIDACIDANMKATSEKHALRTGDDADAAFMSIDGFASEYNVHPVIIRRLSRSGLVPVVKAKDAKRSPVRMAVADVLPLLSEMKDAMGRDEAAGLLSLPLHVLPGLADRKLLDRLEGPVVGLVPGNAGYTRSSVQGLLDRLWRRSAGDAPDGAVPLITAARSIGPGEAPWAAIIAAILAGQVRVFADGGQRRSIRYALAVTDVGTFVEAVRNNLVSGVTQPPEWIGNATAAEILKVTEVFVWRLAKLRPDILKHHSNGYTPFKWTDVDDIAKTYIFVPEVMDRAGLKARRVCAVLKDHGMKPAFKLLDNRDFAFFREEVEALLPVIAPGDSMLATAIAADTESRREYLLAAVARGAEIADTARKLGVEEHTARGWVKSFRTGQPFKPARMPKSWAVAASIAQRPKKIRAKSPLDGQADLLRDLLLRTPKISLDKLKSELAAHGIRAGRSSIWNFLNQNGITMGVTRKRKEVAARRTSPPIEPTAGKATCKSTPNSLPRSPAPGPRV